MSHSRSNAPRGGSAFSRRTFNLGLAAAGSTAFLGLTRPSFAETSIVLASQGGNEQKFHEEMG